MYMLHMNFVGELLMFRYSRILVGYFLWPLFHMHASDLHVYTALVVNQNQQSLFIPTLSS